MYKDLIEAFIRFDHVGWRIRVNAQVSEQPKKNLLKDAPVPSFKGKTTSQLLESNKIDDAYQIQLKSEKATNVREYRNFQKMSEN